MTTVPEMNTSHWAREVAAFVAYMGAAGLSSNTIQMRVYHLSRVAAELGGSPASLTVDRLTAWLAAQSWQPNTRRAYRGSLRAFYSWSMAMGRVDLSPAHQLPSVRVPRGKPRPVPEDGFRMAMRIADKRARLAIMMAGTMGLRRGEVAAAKREHLEADLLGWSMRVKGKGGHVRIVPVPDLLAAEILRRPAGYLFPSSHGGHLTPHHLGKIVSRNLPEGYATHGLRHRFGTSALKAANGNLRKVQVLMGHANIQTTTLYTSVDDEDLRAIVEAVA